MTTPDPLPLQEARLLCGSLANLSGLHELLTPWKCCGAPSLCGAGCQDSELSSVLALAFRVVSDELIRQNTLTTERTHP